MIQAIVCHNGKIFTGTEIQKAIPLTADSSIGVKRLQPSGGPARVGHPRRAHKHLPLLSDYPVHQSVVHPPSTGVLLTGAVLRQTAVLRRNDGPVCPADLWAAGKPAGLRPYDGGLGSVSYGGCSRYFLPAAAGRDPSSYA